MYLFFETIKIVNGEIKNLEYHQKRIDDTFINYYKKPNIFILKNLINIPDEYKFGVVKCKFKYDLEGFNINFSKYTLIQINKLKLVYADHLKYDYKYYDRSGIDNLFKQKQDCDDIIIVKNNRITDTSFCNIVFNNGIKWITPDLPLLNGTCRRRLLEQGRIEAQPIFIDDIYHYKALILINAMRGDDFSSPIDISAIK